MRRLEIDWEEVQIRLWPAASIMLWLFAAPVLWMHHQESRAFDRESETLTLSSTVQRAYRDRIFRDTPPPPPKGERIKVDVRGVIVEGDRVR